MEGMTKSNPNRRWYRIRGIRSDMEGQIDIANLFIGSPCWSSSHGAVTLLIPSIVGLLNAHSYLISRLQFSFFYLLGRTIIACYFVIDVTFQNLFVDPWTLEQEVRFPSSILGGVIGVVPTAFKSLFMNLSNRKVPI